MLNKENLHNLYIVKKLSSKETAKILSCSEHTVNYWLQKYKIPKRSISEAIYQKHNPDGDPFDIRNPVTLAEAKLFGLGLGLYWGEGTKKSKNAIRLGNTDPKLIKNFIKFLIKTCGIKSDKLKFGLQIFSDIYPKKAERFWQNELGVSKFQFFKTTITPSKSIGTYRQKSKYGVLTVYYGNTKLKNIICELIENMPG